MLPTGVSGQDLVLSNTNLRKDGVLTNDTQCIALLEEYSLNENILKLIKN